MGKRMKEITEKNLPWMYKGMFFFAAIFAAYIQFLNPYITCDHIGMALFRPEASFGMQEILDACSGGRFGVIPLRICYVILGKLHVSHYENMYVLQIMGILLFAVCCVMLHKMFAVFFKDQKKSLLVDSIILLCFINPFMVEAYLYGSFDWAFGILLAVIAAKWLIQKKYIRALLMAFFTVSVYQTNIFIVVIIALFACFLENIGPEQKKWKLYVESIKVVLTCGGAAALNIVIFKLFAQTGNAINEAKTAQASDNYFALILKILRQVKSTYVGMFGTYPLRFFPIFIMLLCGGTILFLIWRRQYYQALIWILGTGILFLLPFAYMLAQNSTWCAQRTLFPVFFAAAMFFMGTLFFVKDHPSLCRIFTAAFILFGGVTWYYTQTLITDCYTGQALDYSEVICIEAEIQAYEERTGITVDTVSWIKSKDAEYVHPLLMLQDGNLCSHRIIYDAGDYLLALVSQKDYKLLWMTQEEYRQYFGDKEWDVFCPEEQLYFEGNVLYWVVY